VSQPYQRILIIAMKLVLKNPFRSEEDFTV